MTSGSVEENKSSTSMKSDSLLKLEKIREQVIGLRTIFSSPFSFDLETVYADHTATHRPYQSIEKMIAYAKTLAANPHT